MKSLLVWACSLAILFAASTARADDDELPPPGAFTAVCAPEIQGEARGGWESREVVGETLRVRWLPLAIMRCMSTRVGLLPRYAIVVQQLNNRIVALDDRVVNLTRQRDSAEEGEEVAMGAVEAANRGQREALEQLGAWHRSRALWFALGVIFAGAVVALTAYALDQVRGP